MAVQHKIKACVLNYDYKVPAVKFEELWILIKYEKLEMVLGAVYLPPMSNKDSYQLHCDSTEYMSSIFYNTMLCIVGDHNLPEISWHNDDLGLLSYGHNSSADCLLELFLYLNLFQHNSITNANHVMLDLIFSNDSTLNVSGALEELLKCDKHHPAIAIYINCDHSCEPLEYEEFLYNFKNSDFNAIPK